jgi:hypothetical protein
VDGAFGNRQQRLPVALLSSGDVFCFRTRIVAAETSFTGRDQDFIRKKQEKQKKNIFFSSSSSTSGSKLACGSPNEKGKKS